MYSGAVLVVDLATGATRDLPLEDALVVDRVGGGLVNLELMRRHGGDDAVVLGAGPLTGALVPNASSATLTARSPLTGGVVHCPLSDRLGAELKYAGYDFVVLRGACERPSYLWVHDEQAELVPAPHLGGADAFAITDAVRDAQGDERVQVLAAGPACQAGSIAGALTINYWASADRAALGALFGRGRLLAVAARGMGELEPHDVDAAGPAALRLLAACRERYAARTGPGDDGALADAVARVAPLVHRRVAPFFGVGEGAAFLMLDEPPARMERSEARMPGVLLADPAPLVDLAAAGLDGPAMGRVTRRTYRLGLDPSTAAAAVRSARPRDERAAMDALDGLVRGEGGPTRHQPPTDLVNVPALLLSLGVLPTTNPRIPTPDGVDTAEELAVTVALAHVLGLDPALTVACGLDARVVEEVSMAVAGPGLTTTRLEASARRLVRETVAMERACKWEGAMSELRGRFA